MPIRGNYRDHDCGANHESQHFSTQGHGCILPSASTIKNFSTTISRRAPEQWLEEAAPGEKRRARSTLLPTNLSFWFTWRGVWKEWSRIGFFCARCGDQTVRSNLSIYELLSINFVRRSNLKPSNVIFIPTAIALIRPEDNLPLSRVYFSRYQTILEILIMVRTKTRTEPIKPTAKIVSKSLIAMVTSKAIIAA